MAMVSEAIDQRGGHGGIFEHGIPLLKGQIGSDNQGFSLIPARKDGKQEFGSLLIQGQIPQFVYNQQIQLFQSGLYPTELVLGIAFQQLRHQIGGGVKGHPFPLTTGFHPESVGQMGFPSARIAQQDNILGFTQVLSLRQLENQWFVKVRHGRKVKFAEHFFRWEPGLSDALLQGVLLTVLDFLLNQQVQELLMGESPIGFRNSSSSISPG